MVHCNEHVWTWWIDCAFPVCTRSNANSLTDNFTRFYRNGIKFIQKALIPLCHKFELQRTSTQFLYVVVCLCILYQIYSQESNTRKNIKQYLLYGMALSWFREWPNYHVGQNGVYQWESFSTSKLSIIGLISFKVLNRTLISTHERNKIMHKLL